jgi:hypothetical protein
MGHKSKDIRLIASTVSEIENLVPYLLERKSEGARINVSLYALCCIIADTSDLYRSSMAYLLLFPIYHVLRPSPAC